MIWIIILFVAVCLMINMFCMILKANEAFKQNENILQKIEADK